MSMTGNRARAFFVLATVAILTVTVAAGADKSLATTTAQARGPKWIAAWAMPYTGGSTGTTPSNSTVRNIARVSIGGTAVRIRLTNAAASTPLAIGAAYIGLQLNNSVSAGGTSVLVATPEIVTGTTRQITFNGGQKSISIPAGTDYIYSDPVGFPVQAQQNVAVSLYLPSLANPAAGTTTRYTSYSTPSGTGNWAANEAGGPFTVPLALSTYALTAIDVLTTEADGAVVGLGSSTFNGWNTAPDEYQDVLTLLSVRVNRLPLGQQKGIVNAGIAGDTLHAALATRLDRDVLSQSGVSGVIVYDVNDISTRTAGQIADDYLSLIALAHARGIKVFCPTWPPAAQSLIGQNFTGAAQRHLLNEWLMNSDVCDGVVDWDAVLRFEAGYPEEYHPDYISDGIHPNPIGHRALADSVPLGWFVNGWPKPPQ
jgi:lysophospholipase L1-like esterase